jgi:acyl-CoA dehydrogenase
MQFLHGLLSAVPFWLNGLIFIAAIGALAFYNAKLWHWTIATLTLFFLWGAPGWLLIFTAIVFAVFLVPAVRTRLLTVHVFNFLKKSNMMPAISETEQTAIEAGNTWIDAELFSGNPDFNRILNESYPELTKKEQDFIDGPVEKLCQMTNDWEVMKNRDLPESVWTFLKKEKFFGLIIPEEYGGLGFSATGNSAVVTKISSRCGALATTQMVPNSLGPAELIIHYGTQEQKEYYLPRLADGREIPCFALTEPTAGSDAGGMTSNGEVFKADDGELYIRLNWKKRYITLASISTVLGLAFKLRDPDNLLGKGKHPGITCALIPTKTDGVILGKRHDPLNVPFINCPTEGKDVIVSVDSIIGGPEQAGGGWRMLMESLAVGRGISLPGYATGGSKLVARYAGAYATVRKQFGLSIGQFEGVQEPLARIAGYNYILDAMRRFTCGGLDTGAKPAVVTAMAKYNATEFARNIMNDGMDVVGGAGISRGPRNVLASGYFATPIGITVEGANILTRTLMVFGQGAIRCHPFAYEEVKSLANGNLSAFDRALWGHIGHVVKNFVRASLLYISRGYIAKAPNSGLAANYYKKMRWASASFALWADVAMAVYGGNLKRKEKLTGRFADIFSWLYMGSAVLRRFEAEGQPAEDIHIMKWSMDLALAEIQKAFDGIFSNINFPGAKFVGWLNNVNKFGEMPDDRRGSKVANMLLAPSESRDRLTAGMFIPEADDAGLGKIESAFLEISKANLVLAKVKDAMKDGVLPRAKPLSLLDDAVKKEVIAKSEAELVRHAEALRNDAIQVDEFTADEYMSNQTKKASTRKKTPTKKMDESKENPEAEKAA